MSIWNRSFSLPQVISIAFVAGAVASVVTVMIMSAVYTTVPEDKQTETTLSAEDVMRELEVIKQIVSDGDATVVADAEADAEADAKDDVNIAGTIVLIGALIMLVIGIAVLTIRLSRR